MAERDALNIAEISAGFLTEMEMENACEVPDMQEALLCAEARRKSEKVSSLEYELACMRRAEVVYEPKISAFNSKAAALIITVKKAICKLCRFWGEPLTDQINTYHQHIYEALRATSERLSKLEQENKRLQEQVEILEKQLRAENEHEGHSDC